MNGLAITKEKFDRVNTCAQTAMPTIIGAITIETFDKFWKGREKMVQDTLLMILWNRLDDQPIN